MAKFEGFPPGKVRQIPIPNQFFTELLPAIKDAGELKVLLYCFWRLSRAEGVYRFISQTDFEEDELLLRSLGTTEQESTAVLRAAIDQSVARGSLLEVKLEREGKTESVFFLNTPRGRSAVEAIASGSWNPDESNLADHYELEQEPASIFQLYEDIIGPLNPMIADILQEAESLYPAKWIQEAFRIAAENNVRRWRYIEAILQRWSEEGKDERRDQGDSEEGRQRYVSGRFSEFIEH